MNVHKLCMNCMRECLDENGICSACGAIESEIKTTTKHLPMRSILKGKYLVGSVLGEGGFGITYVGYDLDLHSKVAIKEFCPSLIAGRENSDGITIVPYGAEEKAYYEGEMDKFINEAQRMARFRKLDGVVYVLDYFKENNTAYIVMEYIEGTTLKNHCKQLAAPMQWEELLALMRPIIRSLQEIHKDGTIHRDISPDNIMVSEDCKEAYLIDFGTARDLQRGTMSAYQKGFYTPVEQTTTKLEQGPWTDVYALCATMYKCLTGKKLPVVNDRLVGEDLIMPSQFGIHIPTYIEETLEKGLALYPKDRIQTMEELEQNLYAENAEDSEKTSNVSEKTNNVRLEEPVSEKITKEEKAQIYSAVNMNGKYGIDARTKTPVSKVIWTIMFVLLMFYEAVVFMASCSEVFWEAEYHLIYVNAIYGYYYGIFLILTACVWGRKGFRFGKNIKAEKSAYGAAIGRIVVLAVLFIIRIAILDISSVIIPIAFLYIAFTVRYNHLISNKMVIAQIAVWICNNIIYIQARRGNIDRGWLGGAWMGILNCVLQGIIILVTLISLIYKSKQAQKQIMSQ